MRRRTLAALGALGTVLALAPTPALAQAPFGRPPINPNVGPPVSPYINLFRSGSPALNYYGLVRPQQDFRQSIAQLQQQGEVAPGLTPEEGAPAATATGHPTRFFNYSHYYRGTGLGPAPLGPIPNSGGGGPAPGGGLLAGPRPRIGVANQPTAGLILRR